MNRFVKIPAIVLVLLIVSKLVWPGNIHHAPIDPKSFVLDVGVEGAGSFQISVWIPAGSTSDSVPGIAHVLEHLKFKNHDSNGFSGADAIAGSSFNAGTTYRYTRYDLNVPSDGFAKALATLATVNKPLIISEADVKLEKSVVSQELYQRSQSDPDSPLYQKFYSELYAGLPYELPPGGTQESVASVKLKDVLAFDESHYKDSKTFLLILGPPLNSAGHAAVEEYFPNSAVGSVHVAKNFLVTRDDAELQNMPPFLPANAIPQITVSELKREKTSPRVRNVKLTVSKIVAAPTTWRAIAAASILQNAIRSRLPEGLQDRIAEDNRLVQDWSVSTTQLMDGVWQIDFSAAVENNTTPAIVRATFEKYFDELSANGLSQKSFDRLKARNFLISEWESPEGRGASLGAETVIYGYQKAVSYLDELQKTDLKDVNDLLRALHMPGRVGEFQLKPEGAAQ
jgi:predicted Zn-dependent peptidase